MSKIEMHHVKRYIVEIVGTFILAMVVILASYSNASAFTPILAAIVIGFVTYVFGPISGGHANPAITLGVLSVKKMLPRDAAFYILAQVIGAFLAYGLAGYFLKTTLPLMQGTEISFQMFVAETLGALIFGMGFAAVLFEKTHRAISGVVIGGALLLGILFASFGGAYGFLNPAVALSMGALDIVHILAPIVGVVVGFQFYKFLAR